MKYSKELHDRIKLNNVLCDRVGAPVTYTTTWVIDALLDEIERLQNENALLSAEVRDYDALREQISDPKPEED